MPQIFFWLAVTSWFQYIQWKSMAEERSDNLKNIQRLKREGKSIYKNNILLKMNNCPKFEMLKIYKALVV